MADGQIPVKVYYLEGGVQKEIRKFTLEQDASTSYTYVLGRIKVFFTSLLRKDLDIYWKGNSSFVCQHVSELNCLLRKCAISKIF